MPIFGNRGLHRRILGLCFLFAASGLGNTESRHAECFSVDFPGSSSSVTAVPVDKSILVTILPPGIEAKKPVVSLAGKTSSVSLLGYDPVSRLVFLKTQNGSLPFERRGPGHAFPWRDGIGPSGLSGTRFVLEGTTLPGGAAHWIKQIHGKVLPFALLKLEASRSLIPPGTAVLDVSGQVAAIVFQSGCVSPETRENRSVLAIPAQAVHRVLADVLAHGSLVRGYIGLSFRPEIREPRVLRVLPGSPAFTAGMLPGDTISRIGDFPITEYSDVSNAFFYLAPGKPVALHLVRSGQPLHLHITPSAP